MKHPVLARASSRTISASGAAMALVLCLAAVACVGPGDDSPPTDASSHSAATEPKGRITFARPTAKPRSSSGPAVKRPAGAADYRFLSAPDFMNLDVGDVSTLPTWQKGMPNSWNSSYAQMVDTILDTFESEKPEDVLVAGDLVEGYWGQDADRTGIFGPVGTNAQKAAALERAANFYFSHWRGLFDQRDLPVYAAVGDHDIGDNPWSGGNRTAQNDFKRNHVDTFKSAFYRNVMADAGITDRPSGPARGTAYATYLSPEVLLVTVDVFQRTDEDVIAELDREQVTWLDGVLTAANRRGTDWIIVQGHTPVLTPVRTFGSSALSYSGGTDSAFWRTMAEHRVDVYLNGEVHDISVRRADGITQIAHGGTIQMASASGRGATSYIVGEIFGDRMFVRTHRFAPKMIDDSTRLWQTGPHHRPVVRKEIWDRPLDIGRLVLTSDNRLVHSEGVLLPYRG